MTRPVYRNTDAPHEEDRNMYCPNMCKFKDSLWNYPCIDRPEFPDIKALGQLCFVNTGGQELTCEQVESTFLSNMPPYVHCDGVLVSDNYIQVLWYDNICPVQFIRYILGQDLSCIDNAELKELPKFVGYSFSFDCHDAIKSASIKKDYKVAVDPFVACRADVKLKEIVYNDIEDYTHFYFELEDKGMIKGIYDFCDTLGLEIAFNRFEDKDKL